MSQRLFSPIMTLEHHRMNTSQQYCGHPKLTYKCPVNDHGEARSNSASLWHSSCKHQVGIACFGLASLVLIVGQHMLSMPSSGLVHLPLFSLQGKSSISFELGDTLARFPSFILGIVSKQCKSRQVLLSSWLATFLRTLESSWHRTRCGYHFTCKHARFATLLRTCSFCHSRGGFGTTFGNTQAL